MLYNIGERVQIHFDDGSKILGYYTGHNSSGLKLGFVKDPDWINFEISGIPPESIGKYFVPKQWRKEREEYKNAHSKSSSIGRCP